MAGETSDNAQSSTAMKEEPAHDDDTPFKLVEAPLKKVRGSKTDEWNHLNPSVPLTVKLTPYRPAFDKNPDDERMLPEVDCSPFAGIPVDEYEKNVITIASSDEEEEDFDTWREKESKREAEALISMSETINYTGEPDISLNNVPGTSSNYMSVTSENASDPRVGDPLGSSTISVHNDTNARCSSISLQQSKTPNAKLPSTPKSNQKADILLKPPPNKQHVSLSKPSRTETPSTVQTTSTPISRSDSKVKTTPPPRLTPEHIKAPKTRSNLPAPPSTPSKTTRMSTPMSTPKSPPILIRATPKCVSEVERLTKGMGQVKDWKRKHKEKEVRERRKHTQYSLDQPDNDANNNNNKSSNRNSKGKNISSKHNKNDGADPNDPAVGALVDKILLRKKGRGSTHEPIEYIIPKKKTSLRATAVSQLQVADENASSDLLAQLQKLHENGPTR